MKYLKQFFIIMLISFLGELLYAWLPLPIPASIYGLVLMFLGLETGILKLHQVKDVGHFLVDIMPILFVPACVGLMDAWGKLSSVLLPFVVIALASTILVMGVSAQVTQQVIFRQKKKQKEEA